MSTEVVREIVKEKAATVEEITTKVKDARIVILSDYCGLTANEVNELRGELRASGAVANVYKNTLTRRALDGLNIEYPSDLLQGPNMFISTDVDAVKVSKVVSDFAKNNETLTIKGGFLQEEAITVDTIKELAKLPSREELVAKAVGLIKAPLTALVGNLSGPVRGLTGVLSSIQTKKDGGES